MGFWKLFGRRVRLGIRNCWERSVCTNMGTKSVMDCILGKGNWSGVVRDIISKILSHGHHKTSLSGVVVHYDSRAKGEPK